MPYQYLTVPQIDDINDLVTRRLVSVRNHPVHPLRILNYTKDAQIMWAWKHYPLLLACRGLVLDDKDRVIAQGFTKFFNHGDNTNPEPEYGNWFKPEVILTEKYDGSMILAFDYQDETIFATRGSFESEQTGIAKGIWCNQYREPLAEGSSYIFELIGPSNRHVVDYPKDELVMLGIIDRHGNDARYDAVKAVAEYYNVPVAERHTVLLDDALKMNEQNREGFIYSIEHAGRVVYRSKIKFETYMAAHKVVFGGSGRDAVYQAWCDGTVQDLVNILPSSHAADVVDYVERLNVRQRYVTTEVSSLLANLSGNPNDRADRANMAKVINQHPDSEVRTGAFTAIGGKGVYRIRQLK